MKVLGQLRTALTVLRQARRNRLDLVRALARRPQLLAATGMFELGVATSARVEPRLNQGLGIRPSGFSDDAYCALPEPAATTGG